MTDWVMLLLLSIIACNSWRALDRLDLLQRLPRQPLEEVPSLADEVMLGVVKIFGWLAWAGILGAIVAASQEM